MHLVCDSFGKLVSQTSPLASLGVAAVDCLFGYTGKAFDRATGLQNNLNRWFDPSVGTWLSEDPAAADENLYRYAGNGPTDGTDPSGLKGRFPTTKLGNLVNFISEDKRVDPRTEICLRAGFSRIASDCDFTIKSGVETTGGRGRRLGSTTGLFLWTKARVGLKEQHVSGPNPTRVILQEWSERTPPKSGTRGVVR